MTMGPAGQISGPGDTGRPDDPGVVSHVGETRDTGRPGDPGAVLYAAETAQNPRCRPMLVALGQRCATISRMI
jgi:hypothetical protein